MFESVIAASAPSVVPVVWYTRALAATLLHSAELVEAITALPSRNVRFVCALHVVKPVRRGLEQWSTVLPGGTEILVVAEGAV
jgi:hypothetical protein